MRIYFRDNSMAIEVEWIRDEAGSAILDAEVTAQITLPEGGDVPGVSNPVILYPNSGSYVGIVDPVDQPVGSKIVVEVTSIKAGKTATSRETVVVKDKKFGTRC